MLNDALYRPSALPASRGLSATRAAPAVEKKSPAPTPATARRAKAAPHVGLAAVSADPRPSRSRPSPAVLTSPILDPARLAGIWAAAAPAMKAAGRKPSWASDTWRSLDMAGRRGDR
ncbi:MAG: hypothetical protein AT715_01680 [Thermoproteus sp. JCHS_4]|nr:MAG: hypothetical protein AT715_01680 [Thermoproteus sp. JCHS_4]